MNGLFNANGAPEPTEIHPPWEKGQYVTYFFQREDGYWMALRISLAGVLADGAWAVLADFKDSGAETRAYIRCNPEISGIHGIIPGRTETLRSRMVEGEDQTARMWHDPSTHLTFAMNLLFVRQYPTALAAVRGEPRQVDYPCGIGEAYLALADAPGYKKHIDVCPRVPITGVARQAIDGDRNPITVTSFGNNDPEARFAGTYDDYIDWSHMTATTQGGVELTYPATWFLRPMSALDTPDGGLHLGAQAGGTTCAALLSAVILTGSRDLIEQKRAEHARLAAQEIISSQQSQLPWAHDPFKLDGVETFGGDVQFPGIVGKFRTASFDGGDRLVTVSLNCVTANSNPRRDAILADWDMASQEILSSFRFI